MNEHEKWLSRRAYQETFSLPSPQFPNWLGVPNKCKCGCGEIWHDRLSPTNWWSAFDPSTHVTIVKGLFSLFRWYHKALWQLPTVVSSYVQIARARYNKELIDRMPPSTSTTTTTTVNRAFWYGLVVPCIALVWVLAWIVSKPGMILIVVLFFAALVPVVTFMLIALIFSLIAISMSGIVLILAGVGSILYLKNPALGIALFVLGVGLQYEINRRAGRRKEEQIGHLIRMIRPRSSVDP